MPGGRHKVLDRFNFSNKKLQPAEIDIECVVYLYNYFYLYVKKIKHFFDIYLYENLTIENSGLIYLTNIQKKINVIL